MQKWNWEILGERSQKQLEICGRTSGKKKDKKTRWWNDIAIQAFRRKNIALRRWSKTRKQEYRQNYITEKKHKKVIETEK